MNALLSVIVLLLVGLSVTNAMRSRMGGGAEPATNAPHACLILVRKPELNDPTAAYLGGGSIVSRNRVLTAAHLVNRAVENGIQLAFFQGAVRHRVNAFSYVNANGFDDDTRENDISVLIFTSDVFPAANVITINVNPAHASFGNALVLASFGFTTPTSTGPSAVAMKGPQTNVVECEAALNATASHFCAFDNSATASVVCFGDNGSGLFLEPEATATPATNFLIGVVSQIQIGCAAPLQTSYTALHMFANFFISMGIPTVST